MGRSITQATPGDGPGEAGGALEESPSTGLIGRMWVGPALVALCFLVYLVIHPDRQNIYTHFVLQAQAWLDGQTAIPLPGYQDVMPLLTPDGEQTGFGIIPFPPLPAWVLLPFVAVWHLGTNQQLISAVFAALDVGLAYWMLGRLPVRHPVRVLTALFFGLGTVLFYSAAIGSTWFWAHIVGVGGLLLSMGLALSADRDAAEPRPLGDAVAALRRLAPRRIEIPGGLATVALLVAMAALGVSLLVLAGAGTPPTALPDGLVDNGGGTPAMVIALLGLLIGVAALLLAAIVGGRPGTATPIVLVVAVVAGLPAVLITGQATIVLAVADTIILLGAFLSWWRDGRYFAPVKRALSSAVSTLSTPEAVQVAAGLFFGLAVTARLTILFGFPFLMLVGGGGSWMRRTLLAGAGAAVPLAALLVVTYATSGFVFNPAYVFQYDREVAGYGAVLGYHLGWSISDLRYVPHNLMIMLFNAPEIAPQTVGVFGADSSNTPACVDSVARGLFDTTCPIAMPDAVGTGLVWSSPAYLLAAAALRPLRSLKLDRLAVGASVAVVAIAFVNLMHFSQGWVQFGYRFSNDFAPFAIVLVALGANRLGRWWPALVPLVVASIAVSLWGTVWGVILGW